MKLYHALTGCGLLLWVAGCSPAGTYDDLKEQNPQAGNFNQSLAAEYLAYAESQMDLGNVPDADYFASKGLRALRNEPVAPEEVSAFIGQPHKDHLEEARQALLMLLTENVRRVLPHQAARAQVLYDCWYHQSSQLKIDGDAPCEAEFSAEAEELETVQESFTHKNKRRYVFHYKGTSTELSEFAHKELDTIAQTTQKLRNYEIELHAMPMGRGQTHDNIARIRAEAVREALIAKGVDPQHVEIHDDTTAKTVYLSHDRKEQPKNTVAVHIKAVGLITEGAP